MEPLHQGILLSNIGPLCRDLDVSAIETHLLWKRIVTFGELESVKNRKTRTEKVRELISLLMRKGPNAFGAFHCALKDSYGHLYDALSICPADDHLSESDEVEKLSASSVHQALITFENQMELIIRLRENTQYINGFLASLNLPAAIEEAFQQNISRDLLEKAAKIRKMGGLIHLDVQMAQLSVLLDNNRNIVNKSEDLITKEDKIEIELREQYQDKWTSTYPEDITKLFREEVVEHHRNITDDMNVVEVLKERYSKPRENIELLCQSESDLESALTSSGLLMDRVNAMKEARKLIENEIKKANLDSISSENTQPKSRSGLQNNPIFNNQSHRHLALDNATKYLITPRQHGLPNSDAIISSEQFEMQFGRRVSESLQCQAELLAHIQRTNAVIQELQTQTRPQCSEALETAFELFRELDATIEETTKHCINSSDLLDTFHQRVSNHCISRKTQREEMEKELLRLDSLPCENRQERRRYSETAVLPENPPFGLYEDNFTRSVSCTPDLSNGQSVPTHQALAVGDCAGNMLMWTDNQHWQPLITPLAQYSKYSACASPDGFIISGASASLHAQSNCFLYNALANKWDMLPGLTTPRWHHSSVCHQRDLYIVGGKDRHSVLDSVDCLDLNTQKWSILPAMPVALRSPSVVFVSKRLFVLGRFTMASTYGSDVIEHNFEQRTWQQRRSMPKACINGSCLALDGKILVLGGETMSCMSYNPRTDTRMSNLERPQLSHSHGAAVQWNGKVLVCGGDKEDSIEAYCHHSDLWSTWDLKLAKPGPVSFAVAVTIH